MGHLFLLCCIVYVIYLTYRNPRKRRFMRNLRGDFIEVSQGRDFGWDIMCIICLVVLVIFFVSI